MGRISGSEHLHLGLWNFHISQMGINHQLVWPHRMKMFFISFSLIHVYLAIGLQGFWRWTEVLSKSVPLDHAVDLLHVQKWNRFKVLDCSVSGSNGVDYLPWWGLHSIFNAPWLWWFSGAWRPVQNAESPLTAWLRAPLKHSIITRKKHFCCSCFFFLDALFYYYLRLL